MQKLSSKQSKKSSREQNNSEQLYQTKSTIFGGFFLCSLPRSNTYLVFLSGAVSRFPLQSFFSSGLVLINSREYTEKRISTSIGAMGFVIQLWFCHNLEYFHKNFRENITNTSSFRRNLNHQDSCGMTNNMF